MKRFSRIIPAALVAVSLVGIAGLAAIKVSAAAATPQTTSSAGNGLKISPVRTDLTINPGATQSVDVTVQNLTASDATYQAIVNDFVAGSGEDGQPSLILDPNKYAPSHSLKRYIATIPNITVAAGQSKTVHVTIAIPKNAAGGGYFGAVRFATASASTNARQNLTLSASVGSLILVKVPGDITDNLAINSFDVRSSPTAKSGSSFFTSNKSLYGVVRFKNEGNVQEQPFGKLTLKKGNKELQSVEINNSDPRGNVLPDSIRRFSINLDKVGSWGKYTIQGNFGYGSNGQLVSATSTFYVVPVALIVLAIVVIVLIIAAIIFVPRAVRNYNRRVLRKAGRR